MSEEEVWRLLSRYRRQLTRQQHKTLAGQIRSGDPEAAARGLQKILTKGA